MQFTRDPVTQVTVRSIERDALLIGDTEYRKTVAVTPDTVLANPGLPAVEQLEIAHLDALLQSAPEMLVIGTGWRAARPPREFIFAMARRGVGCEVMDTPAACRTFNILIAEGRRPAAIFALGEDG